MAKKASNGSGSIRQRSDGRWEARYVVGIDPATGKSIRKSIYGKTQKEVRQKLRAAVAAVDDGTYVEPSKMTVGQWLDIWAAEYLGAVKPLTVQAYRGKIRLYIKPAIGAVRLDRLDAHTIQSMYNALGKPRGDKPPLTNKTITNVHGVLHKALSQAVANGYIRSNPANACKPPRIIKAKIKPLDDDQMRAFLEAIRGHQNETLFTVTLFTGLREGEILGLTWDNVDFERGTITVEKQLQRSPNRGEGYFFAPLKNDNIRVVTPAPHVMKLLRSHKARQNETRIQIADVWKDNNLVFCNDLGGHLVHGTVYRQFKAIAAQIGMPDARFHDLRHSYAVAAIRAGDDIKTVQENLGHATASFTLDVYGHVTEQMQQQSAARMEAHIAALLKQ